MIDLFIHPTPSHLLFFFRQNAALGKDCVVKCSMEEKAENLLRFVREPLHYGTYFVSIINSCKLMG